MGLVFFFKSSGDRFFDPKSLSIDLLVMVLDFFEVTFDRFSPNMMRIIRGSYLAFLELPLGVWPQVLPLAFSFDLIALAYSFSFNL